MSKKWLREVIKKNTATKLRAKFNKPNISSVPSSIGHQINEHELELDPSITYNPSHIPVPYAMLSGVPIKSPKATTDKITKKSSLAHDLSDWGITGNISHGNFNKLLAILHKGYPLSDYEALPKDCRTLLRTEKSGTVLVTENGHYYHFGLLEGIYEVLSKNKIILSDSQHIINIDINVDGLPLTKSSKSQFWPILGSLNNVGCDMPFVIGVFHGYSKPGSASELLGTFIKEYLEVKINKFSFDSKDFEIKIDKFIVDIPAKTFILCVKSHNAYFGCTKCTTEGTFINRRMSFPDLNSRLRNDKDFRENVYDDYHDTKTPLLDLDIDVIEQFPLDYMHLVCLGVMKKLLIFWVRGNISVRLTKTDITKVNLHLNYLKKYMSSEDFSRLPRTLDEVERWKATEFRLFLLYTGPIVLKNKLMYSKYIHFLSLHCAIRILATPELCIDQNLFAKSLLKYFVEKFSIIYGVEYISHNVHNLIHLNEDVIKYGRLDNFSAFKFENYMSEIKKMLKTSKNPLQQFINRVNERRQYKTIEHIQQTECNLKNEICVYIEPLLENKLVKSFKSINFKHFKMGCGLKNNHCIFKVNSRSGVAKIEKIIQCTETGKIFVIVKEYESFKNYFPSPCPSKMFYCGVVGSLSNTEEIFAIESVFCKCINYRNTIISII